MPAYNTYVGARYVPIFDGDWDNTKKYDPLTIVMHEGNSYTSKTYVPEGTAITNGSYWALTGNYNAQVAQLMESVEEIQENRPYVTPEMFGAAGDGVTPDNEALNTCFQFAYENNLIVYGLNKYLVDDTTFTAYAFYGILVPGGVEVHNMHFILMNAARACASILTCKFSTKPYLFKNCTFEMPAAGLSNTSPYDGGNNGVVFIDDQLFPTDFKRGFSNITFDGCNFKNIWTYAIWCTPVDCLLRIENCNFTGFTYPILPYATNAIIQNCRGTHIGERGFGYALADDEIENFTHVSLHKSVIIRDSSYVGGGIYKVHSHPMKDLIYDDIIIDHCTNSGYPETGTPKDFIVFGDTDLDYACKVNNYKIINCVTSNRIRFLSDTCSLKVVNSNISEFIMEADELIIQDSVFNNVLGRVISLIQVDNSTAIPSVERGALRSTGDHWTDDSDCTKLVILNNVVLNVEDSWFENSLEFARSLRFERMFINGFSFKGFKYGQAIVNNYGIRDLTINSQVYATGVISPVDTGDYNNIVDGVKTVIITGIGPDGGFKVNRYTHKNVINTWYT